MFIVIHCALFFGRGIQFLWGGESVSNAMYHWRCDTDARSDLNPHVFETTMLSSLFLSPSDSTAVIQNHQR